MYLSSYKENCYKRYFPKHYCLKETKHHICNKAKLAMYFYVTFKNFEFSDKGNVLCWHVAACV